MVDFYGGGQSPFARRFDSIRKAARSTTDRPVHLDIMGLEFRKPHHGNQTCLTDCGCTFEEDIRVSFVFKLEGQAPDASTPTGQPGLWGLV